MRLPGSHAIAAMALRSAAERTPISSTNAGSGATSSMASRNVAKRHRRANVSAYQAGNAGSEAIRFGTVSRKKRAFSRPVELLRETLSFDTHQAATTVGA